MYLASRCPGWFDRFGSRLHCGCGLQNGQYDPCCGGLDDSHSDRGRRCISRNFVFVLIIVEQLVDVYVWEIYVHVVAARGDLLGSLHPTLGNHHKGVLQLFNLLVTFTRYCLRRFGTGLKIK